VGTHRREIAAGALLVAGAALLARALGRPNGSWPPDEPVDRRQPGLGPHERDELRQIIARTS
jgi:hypothetical protein